MYAEDPDVNLMDLVQLVWSSTLLALWILWVAFDRVPGS